MQKFFTKLFWKMKPLMDWIDKTFTIPFSVKKITGDHYYEWRDTIRPGTIFLSNTKGVGSNLINPAEFKHSAIYFGQGLKSAVNKIIDSLQEDYERYKYPNNLEKIDRLHKFILDNDIKDDICYVIEALGKGVVANNLVKFMTTKDRLLIIEPKFADPKQRLMASRAAVFWLGLPYDYGFHHDEKAKYCFEVVADAYEIVVPNLNLKKRTWNLFGNKLYEAFMAETFLDEELFKIIIDSKKHSK